MKRKVIKTSLVIGFLVGLQYFTFILYGKKELISLVRENSNSYLPAKPLNLLLVYCNCHSRPIQDSLNSNGSSHFVDYDVLDRLSESEIEKMISEYKHHHDSVAFLESLGSLGEYQKDDRNIEYHLCFIPKNLFQVYVPEEVNLNESSQYVFTKSRMTVYLWLYFRWVRVSSEDFGSS